jgi:type II secretory pathway component PulF
MFFTSRIRLKPLTQLCHRLAVSTEAGLEDRRIWHDEAERGSSAQSRHVALIRDALATGESMKEALPATGKFFPPLFRSMVEVGETGGRLGRTYRRLAEHYDKTLTARRAFLGRLAWPLFQLAVALLVVGLLIWVMGLSMINKSAANPQVDMLGFGLIGTPGLIKYVNILVLIAIVVLLIFEAARRGALWTRTLQRQALAIPVIGSALKTLALARFTWALQLVLDTPMDLRRALPLALEASGNDYFARHGPQVAGRIEQGSDIQSALAATGAFPVDLLDHIAVGEESGQLVEVTERQSAVYQEKAGLAISILAQLAGYLIWLIVAGFIIMMIFRLFSVYLQQINDLL